MTCPICNGRGIVLVPHPLQGHLRPTSCSCVHKPASVTTSTVLPTGEQEYTRASPVTRCQEITVSPIIRIQVVVVRRDLTARPWDYIAVAEAIGLNAVGRDPSDAISTLRSVIDDELARDPTAGTLFDGHNELAIDPKDFPTHVATYTIELHPYTAYAIARVSQ